MKWIALLFIFSLPAFASDYHHHQTINKYSITEITNYKGIAAGISASQCHFDGGSYDLQVCGGYGNFDDQDAYTFGIGQKFKDIMINGTVTREGDETAIGFGGNWKIKLK